MNKQRPRQSLASTNQSSVWKLNILSTATLLAISGSVLAQEAQKQDAPKLDDVVVTATKRTTLASKTPASLAVITGDDLKSEGAADTKRLAELMPNVQLGNATLGAVEVSIRGIGSNNGTEVGDAAVGVTIDGVALGRPQMAGAALYDVERVEVLRGPQGTLYGRNSTAGAINIITKKPTQIKEASASFGFSNYSGAQADAMLNLPVNETLAVRGVISRASRDGYVDSAHAPTNTFTKDRSDQDNVSARLHALFSFAPGQSLLLSADYSHDGGVGAGTVLSSVAAANPYGSAGRSVDVPGTNKEGSQKSDSTGISAEYKQGLSFADLTVIGAHRTQKTDLIYSNGIGANTYSYHPNFTQDSLEARLSSNGSGPLQWVGGAYYFKEKTSPVTLGVYNGTPALTALFQQDPMLTESQALFGQATYAIKPELRMTGGMRYTQDTKSRQGCTYSGAGLSVLPTSLTSNVITDALDTNSLPPCPAAANINSVPATSWTQMTYRAGVDYDLDRDTMLYASYATGFKSGGFNDGNIALAVNTNAVLYKPETLTALELGFKGRYLNRRLQVNGSLFSYDYSDLQVSAATTCATGIGTCNVTQNAAKAKSYGLELEGRYLITSADRINFGLGLTNATYTSFVTTAATPADWAGKALDKAPQRTLNLGYSHQFTLASGAAVTAFIGERFSSEYEFSNPANNTRLKQDSFNKTDIHVTYSSPDDKWSVQAYVRNLEDRNIATTPNFGNGQNAVYLAEPRMIGVRANFKF